MTDGFSMLQSVSPVLGYVLCVLVTVMSITNENGVAKRLKAKLKMRKLDRWYKKAAKNGDYKSAFENPKEESYKAFCSALNYKIDIFRKYRSNVKNPILYDRTIKAIEALDELANQLTVNNYDIPDVLLFCNVELVRFIDIVGYAQTNLKDLYNNDEEYKKLCKCYKMITAKAKNLTERLKNKAETDNLVNVQLDTLIKFL